MLIPQLLLLSHSSDDKESAETAGIELLSNSKDSEEHTATFQLGRLTSHAIVFYHTELKTERKKKKTVIKF